MILERLRKHLPLAVLMNTGSLGGPTGAGGARPPIDAEILNAGPRLARKTVRYRKTWITSVNLQQSREKRR